MRKKLFLFVVSVSFLIAPFAHAVDLRSEFQFDIEDNCEDYASGLNLSSERRDLVRRECIGLNASLPDSIGLRGSGNPASPPAAVSATQQDSCDAAYNSGMASCRRISVGHVRIACELAVIAARAACRHLPRPTPVPPAPVPPPAPPAPTPPPPRPTPPIIPPIPVPPLPPGAAGCQAAYNIAVGACAGLPAGMQQSCMAVAAAGLAYCLSQLPPVPPPVPPTSPGRPGGSPGPRQMP